MPVLPALSVYTGFVFYKASDMHLETSLNAIDRDLLSKAIDGFVPKTVIDIHGHILDTRHCSSEKLMSHLHDMDFTAYRQALAQLFPDRVLSGSLVFPFPVHHYDSEGLNSWTFSEAERQGSPLFQSLALAAPNDGPQAFDKWMREGRCIGLKPYHYYSGRKDTLQAELEEFVPEWMWELCDRHQGILMVHLVRDGAVSDPGNREAILRLCRKYPSCRLVLPHIARSFNFRTARGLKDIVELPNVFVDTSAITEVESMRIALDILGPSRVMYGSDYPISHLRGHCATAGAHFHWFYSDEIGDNQMTLTGIESLLCLREACEQLGLSKTDVEGIFWGNAQALLSEITRFVLPKSVYA